jgi:hypothetical protein
VAPNRGKDLPPKCNSVALYGAAFPFLLFRFVFNILAPCLFLNRLAPCLFSFLDTFPLAHKQNLLEPNRGKLSKNVAGGRNREGENGEKSGVVAVDRNDGENNGDEHKVTSNY